MLDLNAFPGWPPSEALAAVGLGQSIPAALTDFSGPLWTAIPGTLAARFRAPTALVEVVRSSQPLVDPSQLLAGPSQLLVWPSQLPV